MRGWATTGRGRGRLAVIVVVLLAVLAACSSPAEQDTADTAPAPSATTSAPVTTPAPAATPPAPEAAVAATPERELLNAGRVPAYRSVEVAVAGIDLGWLTLPSAPAYTEYAQLVDETEQIRVGVPAAWADVDTRPSEWEGQSVPSVWAATSLEGFLQTWDEPGVTFDAYLDAAAEEVWARLDVGADESCAQRQDYVYDSGSYTGDAVLHAGCGESASALLQMVAGLPGYDWLFGVQVQMVTTADIDAAMEVVRSISWNSEIGTVAPSPVTAGGIDFGVVELPISQGYTAYETYTDDLEGLQVAVPAGWTDVDGAPDSIEGFEVPSLWAAPDLAAYLEGWSAPGMQLDLRPIEVMREGELFELGAEVAADEACGDFHQFDYYDGAYEGVAGLWGGCGETGSAYLVLGAGVPEADETIAQFFVLRMVLTTSGDVGAAAEVIRTFHRIDRAPEPPSADDYGPPPEDLEQQAQEAVDLVLGIMAYECTQVPDWVSVNEEGEGLFTVQVGAIDEAGQEIVLTYLVDIDMLYAGATEGVITNADEVTTDSCPLD